MVLQLPKAESRIAPFIRMFTQDICDAGLQLGFSLRTTSQACSLAARDATIFTSLVEARLLGGSASLYGAFNKSFRRMTQRRYRGLMDLIEDSRRAERHQYGETVYLLEPNVKRSKGGLRDLHFLRWLGYARYGDCEPEALMRSGVSCHRPSMASCASRMSFCCGCGTSCTSMPTTRRMCSSRAEQLRIAERFGYAGEPLLLPVERFMRDYIEHTNEVHHTVAHFLGHAKARTTLISLIRPVFSHHVDGDFRVDPVHIAATRRGLEKVRNDLAQVLRLMDLANRYRNRIDPATWQAIREAMMQRTDVAVSREAAERFLSLISQPGSLGDLLRRLHELRVLEKIIPAMAHARGLMQFNAYHKYTVDEHSIRAVECATEFLSDPGPLGEAYRGIRDKRTLHLALLVHDLGKGFEEDHSEVGGRLAAETADFLGLGRADKEKLVFLVHKHLVMSHLAQRRNINDDAVVVQFAVEVGSPELLQMLYVLTCADLAAVGPGVLNSWKCELLTRLYVRTREHLTGEAPVSTLRSLAAPLREAIRARVEQHDDAAWWQQQIDALPASYLRGALARRDRGRTRTPPPTPPPGSGRVGTLPGGAQGGRVHRGNVRGDHSGHLPQTDRALTSKGMQILSAEIHTLAENLVLDRFHVQDMDFAASHPPSGCRKSPMRSSLR